MPNLLCIDNISVSVWKASPKLNSYLFGDCVAFIIANLVGLKLVHMIVIVLLPFNGQLGLRTKDINIEIV